MATRSASLLLRALTEMTGAHSFKILHGNPNKSSLRPLASRAGHPSILPSRRLFNLAAPLVARKMEFSESRMLRYTPEQMYDVVARVDQYEQFVPWCTKSRVVTVRNSSLCARLEIGFPPVVERYTSEVMLVPNHKIRVSFEFKSLLHSHLAGVFFDEVVKEMIGAFEKRAVKLYGHHGSVLAIQERCKMV